MSSEGKVFNEILLELRALSVADYDHSIMLNQMAEYLLQHQNIIDFVLQGRQKENESKLKEVSSLYKYHCSASHANSVGITRANYKFISSDSNPIYVLNNKAALSKPVEQPDRYSILDSVYHRAGFFENVSPSYYQTLDEGYPALIQNPQQLKIVSTSAGDSPGGSGIQQILISGINDRLERTAEFITLNGLNPVLTAGKYSQFDTLNAVKCGANNVTAGTIMVSNFESSVYYAGIRQGNNSWRSGRFFTDCNTVGYICQWTVGSYNSGSCFELKTSQFPGNFNSLVVKALGMANNDSINFVFPIPIKLHQSGCVCVSAQAKRPQNEVMTSFELYVKLEPFTN